jgi:hypothetical protein
VAEPTTPRALIGRGRVWHFPAVSLAQFTDDSACRSAREQVNQFWESDLPGVFNNRPGYVPRVGQHYWIKSLTIILVVDAPIQAKKDRTSATGPKTNHVLIVKNPAD